MNELSDADRHALNAARGWLELGEPMEAAAELMRLSPETLAHPEALPVRLDVAEANKDWAQCVEIARVITRLEPESSRSWLNLGIFLSREGRMEEAYVMMSKVVARFPRDPLFRLQLAGICGALGKHEEGKTWLALAQGLQVSESTKSDVWDDPGL